ncbi:hypothetical protein J1P26_11910 [Neobacillus sp. MM2021_6]|uniref:DUF6114 domain-containing protein n=1 Tax=Bacillaceae TaxID=186817 RepID=UPI00140DF223|nr:MULTISPECIES: DUF6114 domain-containing protein [Bacillaceae]MBO0960409.1 hypothetical protein [Neobacillus sp. MM2021_6]NHC16734.1 hypothetical protein [Bacillus sp. MM2020_4]
MSSRYSKRTKFKNWRARRPFWGATLSILSGIIILMVPAQLYEIAAAPGSMIVVGLLLGGLTLLMGVLAYVMPKLSTLFGIVGIFTSVLSIMGALGGFLIGTILGIVGGAMMIAWKPTMAVTDSQDESNKIQIAEIEVASSKETLPE